jgi:ATP-dependent protease ClpP protease subunit
MLIHQLSSGVWGTYNNIVDCKQNVDLLMNTLKINYNTYTKIPTKVLEEILKRDLYLDSKTCKKYGIVDDII